MEMKMKERMNWRSLLRISGMSLGLGVVYEFAPLFAHQAEAEVAEFFERRKQRGNTKLRRPAR
jgi:hypothetical protein